MTCCATDNTHKLANAVGAKTARACDSCITKRARWYCAADDAFLCQPCDASVHSANSLARRHQRVRLKTASYKPTSQEEERNCGPTWHTRKARTRRQGKQGLRDSTSNSNSNSNSNPFPLVPEVGWDDQVNSNEENEDQLLYRVPIFEPFVAELCCNSPPSSATSAEITKGSERNDEKNNGDGVGLLGCENDEDGQLRLPSEMELAEFAADVESLLGRGLENECVGMEELGLADAKEEEQEEEYCSKKVKMEEEYDEVGSKEAEAMMMMMMVVGRDDYENEKSEYLEEKKDGGEKEKSIRLQLDYEGVILAWAAQKSPWTTPHRPDFDLQSIGTELQNPYGGFGCPPVTIDVGGREARVSRYREKRRTRLFSKKIRYEVRKLNAEKRPRMKGRFVKRASFPPPTFPLLNK